MKQQRKLFITKNKTKNSSETNALQRMNASLGLAAGLPMFQNDKETTKPDKLISERIILFVYKRKNVTQYYDKKNYSKQEN